MKRVAVCTGLALMLSLFVVSRASGDPMAASTVVFPFAVRVSYAAGPTMELMGRTIAAGDTLAGELVFSQAIGWSSPRGGDFDLTDARVQFDVPSGYTLRPPASAPFNVWTENSERLDEMQLYWSALQEYLVIDWTDDSGRALTSGAFPSGVGAFSRTELQLYVDGVGIRGASPTPTPEPASLLLLATGIAGLAAARRRSRP